MSKKIAFVVGHTENYQGAYSEHLKMHEWRYFKIMALNHLTDVGDVFFHESTIFSYTARQKEMAERTKDYDLVIELHFNAFDGSARGCCAMYYHSNKKTAMIGAMICNSIQQEMGIKDRGLIPVSSINIRGAGFLFKQKTDAILLECFFGDRESRAHYFDGEKFRKIMQNIKGIL